MEGMILANRIAQRRGILSEEKRRFTEERLLRPTLNMRVQPTDLQPAAIIEAMGRDKKRTGSGLALIMLTEAGEMVRVNDLQAQEVRSALKEVEC